MNPLANIAARQSMNGGRNPMQMIQQFQQFRQQWTPESAQQKINQMLQSGQINAEQLEQAKMMARQMQGMLK